VQRAQEVTNQEPRGTFGRQGPLEDANSQEENDETQQLSKLTLGDQVPGQ